jgi:hypothetical protein
MGPSVLYDGQLHACVTPERFDELLRDGAGDGSVAAELRGVSGGRA